MKPLQRPGVHRRGLAGERVAIEVASQGFDVVLLSLVPPRRSHSCAAEGGMQAATGNTAMSLGDSRPCTSRTRSRARTGAATRRWLASSASWPRWPPGGRLLGGALEPGDGRALHLLPRRPVLREGGGGAHHGLIAARNFGGTSKWRACYTADGTGHTLLYALDNKVTELGIKVHDRVEATSLINDGQRCLGCVVRDLKNGKLRVYLAKATSSPPAATDGSTRDHQQHHQRGRRPPHRPGHRAGALRQPEAVAVPTPRASCPPTSWSPRAAGRRRHPAGRGPAPLHARL